MGAENDEHGLQGTRPSVCDADAHHPKWIMPHRVNEKDAAMGKAYRRHD